MRRAIEEKGYSPRPPAGSPAWSRRRPAMRRAGRTTLAWAAGCGRSRRNVGGSGYRRLYILLRREGVTLNHKKLLRLYREEKLTVRRSGGRKPSLGARAAITPPQGPNPLWSLDFVSEVLADGRRFRTLVVVDDVTRECLTLVADELLSGRRVAREFDGIVEMRGRPLMIVSDNGTEQTSHAILQRQEERGVGWRCIAPGKPQQNGFVEASVGASGTNASTSMSSGACRPPAAGRRSDRRSLADRLQLRPAAHEPRRSAPERVRNPVQTGPEPARTLVMDGVTRGKVRRQSTQSGAGGGFAIGGRASCWGRRGESHHGGRAVRPFLGFGAGVEGSSAALSGIFPRGRIRSKRRRRRRTPEDDRDA